MESRFAHLYQRDTSVSMLRVKMSRRRSQVQKENREKTQNLRRHLGSLLELDASEMSMHESAAVPSISIIDVKGSAAEERKRMLARFKEAKEMRKEKERRQKKVFKVGLYKPQPLGFLPVNSQAPVSVPVPSTRVTRSMKQQQVHPPTQKRFVPKKEPVSVSLLITRASNKTPAVSVARPVLAVEPVVRGPTTRSAAAKSGPATGKTSATEHRAPKIRSANQQPATHASGQEKKGNKGTKQQNKKWQKVEEATTEKKEEELEQHIDSAPAVSFAPQNFVFQPPVLLSSFQTTQLSPRSDHAVLSSSFISELQEEPRSDDPPTCAVPTSPPALASEEHNVPYFRKLVATENDRLTGLCEQWEKRFEDFSVPEEMRDRMRTAVGQARLLMKERFAQFCGLVDDCDLGRGEKLVTCTDLQGFWEMVYFQVEDVDRKFGALREAEGRGWVEETKPGRCLKRVVKKPAGGPPARVTGAGAGAAAKSRLAAVKAAMRAKQQAEKAGQEDVPQSETVVFHGGFFHVESPVKVADTLRRSVCLRAANSPLSATPRQHTTPQRSSGRYTPKALPFSPERSPLIAQSKVILAAQTEVAAFTLNEQPEVRVCPAIVTDVSLCEGSDEPEVSLCAAIEQPEVSLCAAIEQPEVSLCAAAQPEVSLCAAAQPEVSLCAAIERPEVSLCAAAQPEVSLCAAIEWPEVSLCAAAQPEVSLCAAGEPPEVSLCAATYQKESFQATTDGQERTYSENPVQSLVTKTEESTEMTASVNSTPSVPTFSTTEDLSVTAGRSEDVVMAGTPETSITENVPGLDFELYLQPTAGPSWSPGDCVEMETSPSTTDAESMLTPDAMSSTVPLRSPWNFQNIDSPFLLFTPEKRERVRPSVCERDLMMFTPPQP
ncbi:disks large-associated protein 5 isoform X2 [Denticeps clupeoides]|uniref:disks large-associated protein 5 isoform X2 n=1 Tax=Denticeps clupeoides TaxID=299321 RepID=UPI0010A5522B|nr:disks large-associated protein 5 isoform X2 [Denticeps clupeoides]